jgi:excisionase family DNA binding protein
MQASTASSPNGSTNGTHMGTGPGTTPAGLSIPEAAVALGVTTNTVRRWIKSGRLRSEKVRTPSGHAYRVYVESGTHPGTGPVPTPVPAEGTNAVPTSVPLPVPDTARAESMAAYNAALVRPLVEALERQQAIIREQAEELGSLRSELARWAGTSPRPWWRFWRG